MKKSVVGAMAAGMALWLATPTALAQFFPDRGGLDRDPVTGYLCVTPSCDVVRMSEARCICTKDNPSERRLSKLKLTCSKREAGKWVACPVKPRFGG